MVDWRTRARLAFAELGGRTVLRWRGIEMALRGEDSVPEFEVSGLPVRQFFKLELTLDNGPARVETWQDDGCFALCTERDSLDFSGWIAHLCQHAVCRPIFRVSELAELPCEMVSRVDLRLNDRQNVTEALLVFADGAEVLLVAGEAYERDDGSLRFARQDESVLVFRNPADVNRLDWSSAT